MISKPLFIREVKSNYKMLLLFFAILTMYGTIIIAMFNPKLGESIKMMAESMDVMFAAFGMSNFSTVLVEFLGDMLYGFIFVVVPLIFIMLLTSRIITRYIDRGSMAYLLATPNSRKKIIVTQATISILSNVCLVAYMIIIGVIASAIMFPSELELGEFLLINLGLFSLLLFFSGLCFATACIFNEAKLANGIGMGASIAFLLLKMLSQAGEKAEPLKYITPISLFQPALIINHEASGLIGIGILFLMGIAFYIIAIHVFVSKDLSL